MPDTPLNRVAKTDMTPDFQAIYDNAIKVAGEAAFVEVLANHPALLNWYNGSFYGEVFAGPTMRVDLRSKELLRLRLSKGHGCHVCNSFNVQSAKEIGFTDQQIAGIVDPQPGLFDEKDVAIIDLAAQIELGNNEGYLSSDLYRRLKAHFDDGQIVELALVGAILTGFSKFLFVCDLVTREAVCPMVRPNAA